MSIGLLYERSETDEKGIELTAKQLGIDLTYIPFRKVSVGLGKDGYRVRSRGKDYSNIIKDLTVVLNRAQSKNRRLIAASVMEAFGKFVVNPSHVEFICYSKLRTLMHLWKAGIKIPRTVYVPCDSSEISTDGSEIRNEEDIAELIQQELNQGIVVKPDAGTHGKNVKLAKSRQDLLTILTETDSSIINPVGVLSQSLIQKWFYDLRIIVIKEKGKTPFCHPTALARGGFKDFRTNTYLGNMVFGAILPEYIREAAVSCGKTVGNKSEAWLIALDAMIDVGKDKIVDDKYLNSEFEKLEKPFTAVKKLKTEKNKKKDFPNWNRKLEKAFQNYKNQEAYANIKGIIEESVERNKRSILFHEVNACPEFWEQTRMVAGINLAIPLLRCAESLV